jgi:hypothetical protein
LNLLENKILVVLGVFIFNLIIFSFIGNFDIRADHSWRNAQVMSMIENYEDGQDFRNSTFNSTRNKVGKGYTEVPFPIFPYIAGKFSSLLSPIYKAKPDFVNNGPINLQNSIPAADLINITKMIKNDNGNVLYGFNFELYPHMLTPLSENRDKPLWFHLGSQCKEKTLTFVLNNKPINYECDGKKLIQIKMQWGPNLVQFQQPENQKITNEIFIFSMSEVASNTLYSSRLFQALLISTLMLVSLSLYGRYNLINFILFTTIPGFLFFHQIVHEEITALLFLISSLLVLSFYYQPKKNTATYISERFLILSFILLSFSAAIRPYYFLFSLIYPLVILEKHSFKDAFLRYFYAPFLIIAPAFIFYTNTQSRVKFGADTVNIFADRVYFDSFFNVEYWNMVLRYVSDFHLPLFTFVSFLFILFIHYKSKITLGSYEKKLVIINILFIFIGGYSMFDSSVHHNYYIFPVILSIYFILVIYINSLIESKKFIYQNILKFSVIVISIVSFYQVSIRVIDQMLFRQFDDYNWAITARNHKVFHPGKIAIFPFNRGPQAHYLSGSILGFRSSLYELKDYEMLVHYVNPLTKFDADYMYYCPNSFNGEYSFENANKFIPKLFKIKQIRILDTNNGCLELKL